MNARTCAALFACLATWLAAAGTVTAQGFAGLGGSAEGHALPDPDWMPKFPDDHGPHPAFRIEWWYVTANLRGPDGGRYGVQWTLFRSGPPLEGISDWRDAQGWMGHAALSTDTAHYHDERLARGAFDLADVTVEPFLARIDEWRLEGPTFDDLRMRASGPEFAFDLNLSAEGPLVFHGDGGYSVKSPEGQASQYYSQPHFSASGRLTLPDGTVEVTGRAWVDREWSSQPLAETQTGWDWFSLHLGTGDKLMVYRLRDSAGSDYAPATWIGPDGTSAALPNGSVALTPVERSRVAGRDIPTTWRLQLPEKELDITVTALNPDTYMDTTFPYWEGPVIVTGSHDGEGYLEMTGY